MTGPGSVIVLAKEPLPGRVKTRLVPDFTPAQAAALASAAIHDTAAALTALPARHRVLAYDGAPGRWQPAGFAPVPQSTGSLDVRIENALATVLGSRPGPAVLVGMDTPQLAAADLAVDWSGCDAVLGRTDDGGYWALGLRVFVPGCVTGVPMSTDHTGADQLERLRSLGLRVALLPRLRDVDTALDAAAVAAAYPGLRFSGLHHRLVQAGLFDAAFSGRHHEVAWIDPVNGSSPAALDVHRWHAAADEVDDLVISRCVGPTLDIGCGPGRIVTALAERGVPALGVDSSARAVELTAHRGAAVLHRAVQSPLPGEGRWGTVLLLDGNIGIGGDVDALLRRCRDLVRPGGVVIVEVDPGDAVDDRTTLALLDDAGVSTARVDWARVGAPACRARAERAGLVQREHWRVSGRVFLSFGPAPGPARRLT